MKEILQECREIESRNSMSGHVWNNWLSFRGTLANTGTVESRDVKSSKSGKSSRSSVKLGGLIWGTPVASETHLYVGSTNKYFYAIDITNANEPRIDWTYRITNRADSLIDSAASLNPLPHHSQVVVPGGDGFLHALDSRTGELQWRFQAPGATDAMHSSGIVVNSFEGNVRHSADGKRIYVGNDNTYFYCLDAVSGKMLWSFKTDMMIWTVPALFDEFVVFGSLDRHLYVLNAESGDLVAKFNTKGEIKSSPIALSRDSIFVCNSNGGVFSLALSSMNTLRVQWRHTLDAEMYSSPALADGILVVATMDGFVVAFDSKTGSMMWKTSIGDYTTSSPIVIGKHVVIGNSTGRLIALDLTSGAIQGVAALAQNDRNINSSPILLPYGAIAAGSYDGNLYIISLEELLESHDPITAVDPSKAGVAHLQLISKPNDPIITVRLNAEQANAAVIPSSIVVTATPAAAAAAAAVDESHDIRVSPDGKFINLVPKQARQVPKQGIVSTITISGSYTLQTNSWISDRFNFSTEGKFRDTFEIHTAHAKQSVPQHCFLDTIDAPLVRFDIHKMTATQPIILDTYIPAAMDGQGFVAYVTNINRSTKTFSAIFIPAVPDEHGPFEILKEPSKVLHLDGTYECNRLCFTSRSQFTFSAMGGTITFTEFRLFGELTENGDLMSLNYYAKASCLRIKGNGESYKFSSEIVNQLCDSRLDTHVIGQAIAKRNLNHAWPALAAAASEYFVVHFDPVSQPPQFHALISTALPLLPSANCSSFTFVNGLYYSGSSSGNSGSSKANCWAAAHAQAESLSLSSDGFFVERVFNPIVAGACNANVHPNVVTISSIFTTLLMLYYQSAAPSVVPFLMMYKWFADVIDGPIARKCQKTSRLGGVLDTSADWLFTAIVYVMFVKRFYPKRDATRVWIEGFALATLPWFLIAIVNGPKAVYSHGDFKNRDNVVNKTLWYVTENTFVIILAVALFWQWHSQK